MRVIALAKDDIPALWAEKKGGQVAIPHRVELRPFAQAASLHNYIVAPDGQSFLIDRVVEQRAAPISLILNWKAPGEQGLFSPGR